MINYSGNGDVENLKAYSEVPEAISVKLNEYSSESPPIEVRQKQTEVIAKKCV